ncbi:gamma-glutamylcyclotransferase [Alcaligenaceae bacterium]|nr:gamma-glutamylcyclotransferase [Alcaligenaceae bacterium]
MLDALASWKAGDDVWVYGYGSLVWRPEFHFTEQRAALLHGYHRALCLWSRINRGTPEQPGLVFALDQGGSCRGMAYRIPAHEVPTTMEALWRREMPGGAYIPRWLNCRTDQGVISALAFTINRHTEAYVRGLSTERLVDIVRRAHGSYGPCIEYVLETAQALKQSNIQDQRLQALVRALHEAATDNL